MLKKHLIFALTIELASIYQVICQGKTFGLSLIFKHFYNKYSIYNLKDLIISNTEPKFNETITITALNVPNYTFINVGFSGFYCNF